METIYGHVEIKGVGPSYCEVEISDLEGNIIGVTQSDRHGNWRLSPVALPCGKNVVLAAMRNSNGEVFTSDELEIRVGNPADDVIVEAEQLDPDVVEAMQELDAQEQAAAGRAEATEQYLECVHQQARGFDCSDSSVNKILNYLGLSYDQFFAAVEQERLQLRYSKLVCMAAAGIKLERDDERFIWEVAGKDDAEFKRAVEGTRRQSLCDFTADV